MSFIRRITAGVLSALLLFSASAVQANPPAAEPVTVIVGLQPGTDPSSLLSAVRGAELLCEYPLIDAAAFRIPEDKAARLADHPAVTDVSAEASFLPANAALLGTVDPALLSRDDLVLRSADLKAGEGTVIAVIDSGFDTEHPVFTMADNVKCAITEENRAAVMANSYALRRAGSPEKLWVSEKIPFAYDYDSLDTDVSAYSAHGTHVAAIAAGTTAGKGELNGTAPGAQLLLMKVFNDMGTSCREAVLLYAVQDAIQMGADVINLSLGSLAYSSTDASMRHLSNMLETAQNMGILVVCAAGNDGRAGASGLRSEIFRASDPDYGLPSEPAVLPETLAAASAANSVVYADYMELDGQNIFYRESYEVSIGAASPLADTLAGRTLPLTVLPGLGKSEDFSDVSVSGHAVLIRRGEITFEEKVKNAADAGAAAVILYDPQGDDSFLMSVGKSLSIPAVSVSLRDGAYLAAHNGEKLTFSAAAAAFEASETGIASYSSVGPTSDLILKPDITAVGSSVISAIPGGGYGIMNGTSMAAPQIAGLAVRAIAENPGLAAQLDKRELAARLKNYLMSLAEPLRDENGLPLSPRFQGSGVLTEIRPGVLLETEAGGASLSLGDKLDSSVRFTLRLTNLRTEAVSLSIRVPMLTDAAAADESGVYYLTGKSESVPGSVTISGEGVSAQRGSVILQCAGASETFFTVTLTPDAEYVAEKRTIFPNGFYLEGFVILSTEGGSHAASLPFMGFAGDWNAAPMIDATDWDGGESYYGKNRIFRESPEGLETVDNSAAFSFSPDGDGNADSIYFENAPLRSIAACYTEIFSADGRTVFVSEEFDLLKSYVTEGGLKTNNFRLWDGSDGINDHYHWPDGRYEIRMTLVSYTGAVQVLQLPMTVDTVKPELLSAKAAGGILSASFRDESRLAELRIYLPSQGEDGEHLLDVRFTVPASQSAGPVSVSAEIPAGLEYVYVSAEDSAGNKTTVRVYP